MQFLDNGYIVSETKPQLAGRSISVPGTEKFQNELSAFIQVKKARKPKPDIYRAEVQPVQGMENTWAVTPGENLYAYGAPSLASNVANVRYDKPETKTRYALANTQLDLQDEIGIAVFDQDNAGRKYGRTKLKGKETHHITEINTGGRLLNSMPSTMEQMAFVSRANQEGFYFSDHPRNQSALYGSAANVPGPKGAGVPASHPGHSQHKSAHDYVREIATKYDLPDARLSKGGNTIEERMAGLPSDLARQEMGMGMLYAGRLGVQKAVMGDPVTKAQLVRQQQTEHKVRDAANNVTAEVFYDGYMRKLGRRP